MDYTYVSYYARCEHQKCTSLSIVQYKVSTITSATGWRIEATSTTPSLSYRHFRPDNAIKDGDKVKELPIVDIGPEHVREFKTPHMTAEEGSYVPQTVPIVEIPQKIGGIIGHPFRYKYNP